MTQNLVGRGVAIATAAAFAWALTLTASARLHDRVHAGENRSDYSCAVTMVRLGSYLHAVASASNEIADRAAEFANVPELSPCWVPSAFSAASVFEHGPPTIS